MESAATLAIGAMNAPYGPLATPRELAEKPNGPESVNNHDPSAFFSFLSECESARILQRLRRGCRALLCGYHSCVSLKPQNRFIEEMHPDKGKVALIAKDFPRLAGYCFPLSAK